MIFGNRKNIFDILREAEEDENSNNNDDQTTDTNNDSENTNDDTESNQSENNNETEDEYDADEDFSIDTSLDDDTNNEDSGDDSGSDSFDNTSTSSDDSSSEEGSDEPVKANTDIFSSLTNEEQQMKIKELKNLFNQMYCSCDDLLSRINDIDPDETNMTFIERVSSTMYELKRYIGDYIVNVFSTRSYIENDVAFNRFLSILNTISSILNDLGDIKGIKNGTKDDKK